jgi:hypothetical protein
MRWGVGLIVLVCGLGTACADEGVQAQPAEAIRFDSPRANFKNVSLNEYLSDIARLRTLVESCRAKADACDAAKAGEDVTVEAGGGRVFDVRRQWLRNALNDAKGEKDVERAELMAKASARLSSDAAEASGAVAATSAAATGARAKADAILDRTEFRSVEEEGWLSKKWALLALWVGSLIDGAYSRLPHSAWLVPVIEWGLLIAVAVGLIIWAWRVTQQQRIELAVPASDRQTLWQKESDDWARRAETQAAAGEWREAVHCLYWAAIVMLEGRRMWRANRARTPREYLPLLEAGSARQRALSGLTRIFERIWYGLRPAGRNDFEQAQALLEELKAA